VRAREGVVDIIIAERGHRLGQVGIVLFLASVEAGVLEDADIAGQHRGDRALGLGPGAILDEPDRTSRQPMDREHQLRR
jgi:hypothetical protein